METYLRNKLLVRFFLKEKAREVFVGAAFINETLYGVKIENSKDFGSRLCFSDNVSDTINKLPAEINEIMDEVVYCGTMPLNSSRKDGVYRHGSAVATIPNIDASGLLEIKAKDIRSLIEIYAKLFPELVLQEQALS